ncbi:MAG: hypothetical protein V4650_07590 [Pseudomonadota bacterium]
MRLLLAGLALCMATAAQGAGGVFKLVDGDGVVRYDDYSLLAERLSRASLARGLVAADARATVPTEFVAEVAEQCRDLRERSDSYAQAREIYGRDPAGNQYRFSANQVALEVARLQQQTRLYCRPLAAQYLLQEARLALSREQAQK